MSEPNVDALFSAVLAARGPAYLKARDGVVAMVPPATAFLNAKRSSPDWKVALQANILTGWLASPALFRQCVEFVDGKLPGNPGITGEFSAVQRARAIGALGPGVTPCILELLMKVRGLDGKQIAAIVGALRAMADPTAIDPLISLLADDDLDIRMNAAGLLGTFKESRAFPPLLAVSTDARQTEDTRAAAVGSLGQLGAQEAAPTLRAMVANEKLGFRLRTEATRSLAALKDRQAVPIIANVVGRAEDLPFILTLIEALGKIGDRSALPVLHDLRRNPNKFVREAAGDAERALAPP